MNNNPVPDRHTLRLNGVTKVLGGREVVSNLDLSVDAGELVCLLGASGCGKTTTLRMIGGFITPDSGSIEIDGIDYTHTRAEKRPTAMVFQNYALWPTMSVFDNVAFGLKVRKKSKAEIAERVESVLESVGLTHHIRSHPGQISGGEQQRVALARALVLEPSVLLLDEPLSNLDAKLRIRVREEIRELQRRTGVTMVFVTHDQEEALSLADRIAVMNAGQVEQYDAPDTVYRMPSTLFTARFVGTMNLIRGRLIASDGSMSLRTQAGSLLPIERIDGDVRTDEDVVIGIRPEDLQLDPAKRSAAATVRRDIPLGHYREVVVDLDGEELRSFAGTEDRWSGVVGLSAARAVSFVSEDAAMAAARD
jgi:ABC-type Fe3+/spermidine/putrescine transport system ATPase subunit